MNVGLYPRVSTLEQAKDGYSIGEQIERLKSFCAAKNWNIYKIYTDAGFSGANMNRPGLQSMISDIKNGKIDMVLVYKLDRLSRSQKDTLHLIEDVFLANNVHFSSLTENFDTSTPFGRAMVGILSVFAQLEREQFRERSIMGKEARAKEGLHHGGIAPIGYDYINGQLVINEYEALQIRELYRLFLEDHSLNGIIKAMKPYTHKYGAWTHDVRIRSVLKNPLYVGWTHNNGELYKGQHQAIISQEVFDEAQKKFAERSRLRPDSKAAFSKASLLGGFLWCKQCGARYFQVKKVTKRKNIVYSYPKYECYSRAGHAKHMVRDAHCINKIVNCADIDNIVIQAIKGLIAEPDEVDRMVEARKSSSTDNLQRNVYQKRISEIDKSIDKLMNLYMIDDIDTSILASKISTLTTEKNNITDKLESLSSDTPDISVSEAKTILSEIGGAIDSDNIDIRRNVIGSLINKVEIDNDDIFISWKFI